MSAMMEKHGVGAIRQMKGANTTSLPPAQSSKLAKRKERTYSYFLEKVDPILGQCITHLLLEQPSDIPSAMINFLQHWKVSANGEKLTLGTGSSSSRPKKEMKVFLAASISPVISKLANRIAVKLPADPVAFMMEELERMKSEDALLGNKESKPVAPVASVGVRTVQLVVLGNHGSGKTSIMNALQGKPDARVKPTVGFRPLQMMLDKDVGVKLFDLGGGPKIRDIWEQYYHDVHGIVYVVDAADSTDHSSEHLQLFHQTLENSYLKGKPLLIFVNKQDKIGQARSAEDWQRTLRIPDEYQHRLFIAECSAAVSEDASAARIDPNIESSIELLCRSILDIYEPLSQRVTRDTLLKTQAEARKRLERERKVLRSKIASAFVHELPAAVRTEVQAEADPGNVFGENEGLTFLAAEIGEEVEHLSPVACEVAKLVGFQRLALQIVGALKAPISKKKQAMGWMEILALVLELRSELQLPTPVDEASYYTLHKQEIALDSH